MVFVKWDAFNLGFTVLKVARSTNNNLAIKILFFHIVNTVIFAEVFMLTVVHLFLVEAEDFVDAMEGVISIFHAWLKYIWVAYYQDNLLEIQKDVCNYWDCTFFSEKAKTYATFLRTALEKLQIAVGIGIFCIVTLYFILPLLSADRFFVLNLNVNIKSPLLKYTILFSQYYSLTVATCTAYLFEIIFVSLCCQTAIQLELLCEKVRFREGNDTKGVLGEVVKHHQLISSVLRRMKDHYSLVFFLQFVIMVTSACSELLFISIGNSDNWVRRMKSFIYCSYLFLEYAIYCIPSEEICSKMLQFSQAIYFSNWYETLNVNGKDIAFLIMNTQKNMYFTIGEMMDLNMQAYVAVVRATFSFYAFINNMLLK